MVERQIRGIPTERDNGVIIQLFLHSVFHFFFSLQPHRSDDVICSAPPLPPRVGVGGVGGGSVLLFKCHTNGASPLFNERDGKASIDLRDNQKPDDLCQIPPSCQ